MPANTNHTESTTTDLAHAADARCRARGSNGGCARPITSCGTTLSIRAKRFGTTTAAGCRWAAPAGAGPDARPAIVNEQQLRELRAECRMLAVSNEFAINGHENRISYLVGTGHTYRATTRKGSPADAALAGQVQDVLDEFVRENKWQRRQQEIVRRLDRDGEAFLRFFVDRQGCTRIRFVEPDQIATPSDRAGDPAASFGMLTDAEDVETVLSYYVDGQAVDAAEIQHRKANVDGNVKRGLPLFFPVRKNLRRAEKLLRNMSVVAEIQSAIALIRKHQGGIRSGVQQFAASQTDVTLTQAATGRTTSFRRFGPGTILDAPGGIEYDFPAAGLDAASFVAVLQAELRAIASRLVMPEFMLTSDASNAQLRLDHGGRRAGDADVRPLASRPGERRPGSDVARGAGGRRRRPIAAEPR